MYNIFHFVSRFPHQPCCVSMPVSDFAAPARFFFSSPFVLIYLPSPHVSLSLYMRQLRTNVPMWQWSEEGWICSFSVVRTEAAWWVRCRDNTRTLSAASGGLRPWWVWGENEFSSLLCILQDYTAPLDMLGLNPSLPCGYTHVDYWIVNELKQQWWLGPERKCPKEIMGILSPALSALYRRDTVRWCVQGFSFCLSWRVEGSNVQARPEMVHQVHTRGSLSDLVGKFDIIWIHRARWGLLLPPFSLRCRLPSALSPLLKASG